MVRIRTPSGGEFMVQGESTQCGMVLCPVARARRYLQHGCSRYVAYVMDSQERGKAIVDDVSIVREYSNVLPEDFPRLPPERQLEFRIGLVSSEASIAKEMYRLATPEMHELFTQLLEQLDKGDHSTE